MKTFRKNLAILTISSLSLVSCNNYQHHDVEYDPNSYTNTHDGISKGVDNSSNLNNQSVSNENGDGNFDEEKWLDEVEEYNNLKRGKHNDQPPFNQKDIDEARIRYRQTKHNRIKSQENQPCGCCPRYDYITNSKGQTFRVDRGGRVGPYTDQEIRDLRRQNPNYIIRVEDRIVH